MKKIITYEELLYTSILSYFIDGWYYKNVQSDKIIGPIMISDFSKKDLFFLYNGTSFISWPLEAFSKKEKDLIKHIYKNIHEWTYKELHMTWMDSIDRLITFIQSFFYTEMDIWDFQSMNEKILFLIFSYGTDKINSWRNPIISNVLEYIIHTNIDDHPYGIRLFILELRVILKYKWDKMDEWVYADILEVLKYDPNNIHYKCILARYLIANIWKKPGNEKYIEKWGKLLYSCVLKNIKYKFGYINIFYGYYCLYHLHDYIEAEHMFRLGVNHFESLHDTFYFFWRYGLAEALFLKKEYKATLSELDKFFTHYMEDDDYGDGSYKKIIVLIMLMHSSIIEKYTIDIKTCLSIVNENIIYIPTINQGALNQQDLQTLSQESYIYEEYVNIAKFISQGQPTYDRPKWRMLNMLENLIKLLMIENHNWIRTHLP